MVVKDKGKPPFPSTDPCDAPWRRRTQTEDEKIALFGRPPDHESLMRQQCDMPPLRGHLGWRCLLTRESYGRRRVHDAGTAAERVSFQWWNFPTNTSYGAVAEMVFCLPALL